MAEGEEESEMTTIPGKYCLCTRPAIKLDSTRTPVCERCNKLEERDALSRRVACGAEYSKRLEAQKMKMRELRERRRATA
jgi:hypothetical protein